MPSLSAKPLQSRDYVIISPICNEANHLDQLIDSVLKQTFLPKLWVIVDDGSTDDTMSVLRRRCDSLKWIKLVSRPVKSEVGLGIGQDWAAIQEGLLHLTGIDYGYLVKLDGDVVLEPDYFLQLAKYCEQDPHLGMVSGSCWETHNGQPGALRTITGSSWPPARFYRRDCFEAVSAGDPVLGWDMLHVIRARTRGWKVEAFYEPRFFHMRTMGSRGGILQSKVRYGRTSYLMGYSRVYFALRLGYQMFQSPAFLGSIAMLCGYIKAVLKREALIVNGDEKAEMRRMQWRALRPGSADENHSALGYVIRSPS